MAIRSFGGTVCRVVRYDGRAMRKYAGWRDEKPLDGMLALPKVQGPRASVLQRRAGVVSILKTLGGVR